MRPKSTIVLAATLSTLLAAGAGFRVSAQAAERAEDEAQIRAAIADYIGAFFESAPERFENAVHPNLKKRDIRVTPTGTQYLNEMSFSQLMAMAPTANSGQWTSESRQDIEVFDIEHGIASAKLTVDAWIDYFHLAELDGEWKIINVMWAMPPQDAAGN